MLTRPRFWKIPGAVCLIVLTASMIGCAGGPDQPGSQQPNAQDAAVRGEALAGQACGSCHGMGLTGESHAAGAAPFRDMRFDMNAISYQRRLAQLHMGRVSMPPAEIGLDEVQDIRAYARSLRRPRR
jgi:mono/diheme cytochrome c family protein